MLVKKAYNIDSLVVVPMRLGGGGAHCMLYEELIEVVVKSLYLFGGKIFFTFKMMMKELDPSCKMDQVFLESFWNNSFVCNRIEGRKLCPIAR